MRYVKTIAYHLQANEQKIKKYSRKYISHYQDNWPELLMIFEYVYNMRKTDRRSFISFQIVHGEIPAITVKKNIQEIHLKKKEDEELKKRETEHFISEYKTDD